ncbi:MAG: TolC family protein [Acidobacteriota bacterium]|jgi:cobalt-zinc-cadmium efflux system outer membrane protein|nr:TolC family protein [Acidobacteriota bacterium]
MKKHKYNFAIILTLLQMVYFVPNTFGQIAIDPAVEKVEPKQIMPEVNLTIGRYLDLIDGTTADEAVKIALENNGEIQALRDELESTKAQITQAELKPNPRLQIMGTQEGIIGNRYSGGASVSLPLELGNRRGARIDVAEAQFKVREAVLKNSERQLAAEVRLKFGESLALIEKLKFLEELIANVEQGYKLISAKVNEGSNAPLEQNMSVVELNRIRSMREMAVANVEIKLLELRNLMGLEPNEILRLDGDFENMLSGIPPESIAVEQAIAQRPDLESLRLTLGLGNARLEQARSEGRLDAGVSLGFQRMTRIQPMITNRNPVELTPERIGENFITFGVDLMLPVRNKNQGNIESASLEINAAQKRIEFGELTIRREVAVAYARLAGAARALAIYRVGVRNQAKQNLQVVWQTYELGDKDLLDYIGEERRYLELENALIDAELEVYQAKIEIYRALNSPELITK